jgi:hypothetical protein
MAGSQTRLAQPGRQARQRGGSSRIYVFLAILLPAGIVLLPSFVVLLAAMVPTLVAWMIDIHPRKYLAATVGALNFAGSLYFLGRLWAWQHDMSTAIEVLGDVYGWLIAYAAAAAGYGIYYVMPSLTTRLAEFKAQHRLARLERGMSDLAEEWGDAVKSPPE